MSEKINEIIKKITRVFALNFTEEELNLIEDSRLLKIKHEFSDQYTKEFKKCWEEKLA